MKYQDLELVGLGPPPGQGWERSPHLVYQCTRCDAFMPADLNDDFSCDCGAMGLDFSAGRFGSRFGDQAIRVYRLGDVETYLRELEPGGYSVDRVIQAGNLENIGDNETPASAGDVKTHLR